LWTRTWLNPEISFHREIASAIKKLLDAVNEVVGFIPGISGKQAVEQRKKEFVKYSKKFSTTLKEYFKEGQADAVFVSALFLVHVTNQVKHPTASNIDYQSTFFSLPSLSDYDNGEEQMRVGAALVGGVRDWFQFNSPPSVYLLSYKNLIHFDFDLSSKLWFCLCSFSFLCPEEPSERLHWKMIQS
jgi:hypothetical protein